MAPKNNGNNEAPALMHPLNPSWFRVRAAAIAAAEKPTNPKTKTTAVIFHKVSMVKLAILVGA
jgi:hypothetical protein